MSSMNAICASDTVTPSCSANSEYHDSWRPQRASHAEATLAGMSEVQRILDAIFAISSDLELPAVLQRIVQVACDQTGARYGALGVLGTESAEARSSCPSSSPRASTIPWCSRSATFPEASGSSAMSSVNLARFA